MDWLLAASQPTAFEKGWKLKCLLAGLYSSETNFISSFVSFYIIETSELPACQKQRKVSETIKFVQIKW